MTLKPMVDFAKDVAKEVSAKIPTGEQGKLGIDILRFAVARDESATQLDTNAHVDSVRYFTVVMNLGGKGTLLYPNGLNDNTNSAGETQFGFLHLFNGAKRRQQYPQLYGSTPLLHAAQSGSRMSLIMFLSPEKP
jgi:hypothetical protein